MDEKIELLISIIKRWTNKYAYKIYVKGSDEEKKEHYYRVTFFHQNENESISKCTINASFVITEMKLIDLSSYGDPPNINEKYFVSFTFENEQLTRTVNMNLNYEAWIDKLIKDKEKLRGKMDLSSEYMRTRFIKPASEDTIETILKKVKEEREEARRKEEEEEEKEEEKNLREKKKKCFKTENILHKKTFNEETYELDKINSQADLGITHGSDKLKGSDTKNEDSDKLKEVLSFLKSNLYFYFTDIDLKKKGKVKQKHYIEVLKMVNHKMCISYRNMEKEKKEKDGKEDIKIDLQEDVNNSFFYEGEEATCSSSESTFPEEDEDIKNIQKKGKKYIRKDDKKYIFNLFSVNNQDIDLIKDIDIYNNNNFNGSNIFFENLYNIPVNSNLYLFTKDNDFYKYIYTDNYYDFLLYTSFSDEEENGCIYYIDYLNDLPKYLYKLKKNRENFCPISLDSLLLYKQLIYVCYENELNFMYNIFLTQFKNFDPCDSGYIHRSKLKKILQENDHIISKQEYKLLLRVFHYNDDNYVYYKNIKEVLLRLRNSKYLLIPNCCNFLRFEGIRNSIYERDEKLLQEYLCEQLIKNNLKNKKKIHIFDCKNVLDSCDKLYLNKNIIHIILCLLICNKDLELDIVLFLKVSITIIINSIKLDTMQRIYNMITDEKQKKEEFQSSEANGTYKRKKTGKKEEKTNIPALELVERTLTKLFKVLDENNEDHLKVIDFIETLLESNKKKKIIDIKEICKLSKSELQGFVAEINTESNKKNCPKEQMKSNRNFEFYKNRKIHYASHIHKWCSKTYQIRSCEYYSYFLNYPENLVEVDDEMNKCLLFCEEEKE
ncbi:conserved Plasmodium protein, unknown function [Plasmodium ovale wallikeri]|uniref:EF-hand domain-containing protein n=1 Tax=Plasmodium ovale wallikeri TaxID=864142 RepID=A0A1A9A3K3_PLAOA|nr:conserved Plasmodium protein, unknown function [Plasmodium ovale wallikeri]SBT50673.1 conserved Plasmodium protein, unknown function [Plasmodium ovale wallikeri]